MKCLITFILFSLVVYNSDATTINSINNGNWLSPSTWDLNRLPESTDSVKIEHFVQFDQDFTNISPGLLLIGECGILCGDGFYTGCYLIYGILNIRRLKVNFGSSTSHDNYASTTRINVREYIILSNPGTTMSNNGVSVCVGPDCMFDCLDFPVNRSNDCIATLNEEIKTVKIYPNPANEFLIIEGFQQYKVQLMDFFGKLVYEHEFDTKAYISLKEFPLGMYYLVIEQNGKRSQAKIIVE